MIIDTQHHYRTNGNITSDLRSRLRWMDENGIDVAALTTPRGGKEAGTTIWARWNDELIEVERKHPDRFVACPMIPLSDAKAALAELERVVNKNQARAIFIQPYNLRLDYDYLQPFYERIDDLRIPLFFHPVSNELVQKIGSEIEFPVSTTIAVSCLITSGMLDSFRHLKFVIPHVGGALPFTLGRLEKTYQSGRYRCARSPAEYFDNFYFDVVCYSKAAFEFGASVLGSSRLVFGSDFGCPNEACVQPTLFKSFVEGLPIELAEKERILAGQNLAKLLKVQVEKEQRSFRAAPYPKA